MAAVICAEDSPPSFSNWSGQGHLEWGEVSSHEKGEGGREGSGGQEMARMKESRKPD